MNLDLALSENDKMLKSVALDFLKRDAPKGVIQTLQESDTGYTPELWQKVVEMGWLGMVIPEGYGGFGSGLTSAGVLFEALGSGPLPGPYYASGVLSALIIQAAANEAQKQQILTGIVEGTRILTLALTEPEFSLEPESIRTTAMPQGGYFLLNGVKLFTHEALAATDLIVVARTGQGTVGGEGLSLFLVDRQSAGVKVRRLGGYLAGRTFEVRLEDVKVPLGNLLGGIGEGWRPLQQGITQAIPVLCAYQAGASQAVIDQTLEYSRIRKQFGQAIGRFQRVQDWIIEMVNLADAARLMTYEALWKLDTGRDARESVHLAKAAASEAYFEIVTMAHRVFSGISYSSEHPVSFHTRASRALYHYLGDPAYHRQQIAKLLT